MKGKELFDNCYYSAQNVTIAVLNYNGEKILPDCLESILNLKSNPAEVILVDDGSSDRSIQIVSEQFPNIRIIEIGYNSKRLNVVRNRAIEESKTGLVMIVDNDVTLSSNCLDRLLNSMQKLPNASVCMPRTLFAHDHNIIYQDGQTLHYIGATLAVNRGISLKTADAEPRLSIGWGVQLIDKNKAKEVGNFNENYVMGWGDDGEFNHKMNLTGNFCYHIPAAVVYHKRVTGAKRYYGTVRNRIRFLIECYELKTLILTMPALLIYEISLILFLLKDGAIRDYFRAIKYIFKKFFSIVSTRRIIQSKRQMKDVDLMTSGDLFIYDEYMKAKVLRLGFSILNGFLNSYWKLIQGVL